MPDSIDRRILACLQNNAETSLSELADRVGVSKTPCWRRIQRLEKDGYIERRVALLNAEKLNVGLTVFIAIRTDQHSQDWLQTFQKAVQDVPEILGVYRTTGDIDYLLHAVVPDVRAYDGLYQRLIARVPLSDVSSFFVMEDVKHTTALPLDYL